MSDGIDYQVDGGIGVLRVDRPQARNALDWAAQEGFAAAVTAAAADPALRSFIVTGTGAAFIAGGDLRELASYPEAEDGARLHRIMSMALERLEQLPVPVIAAVNADAVGGGCEIMLACDLRVMAADARLRFAQVGMGLTTGWGGAARLVHLIGRSRALDLLLTGRPVAAGEAQEMGLVHRVAPTGADALALARDWAGALQALPRDALAALKRLVYAAGVQEPGEVIAYEAELFTRLWGSANHREAVSAFLEKRQPRFNQG